VSLRSPIPSRALRTAQQSAKRLLEFNAAREGVCVSASADGFMRLNRMPLEHVPQPSHILDFTEMQSMADELWGIPEQVKARVLIPFIANKDTSRAQRLSPHAQLWRQ
jgi:hypothetical protein